MIGVPTKGGDLDTEVHTGESNVRGIGRWLGSPSQGEKPGGDPSLMARRRNQSCNTLIFALKLAKSYLNSSSSSNSMLNVTNYNQNTLTIIYFPILLPRTTVSAWVLLSKLSKALRNMNPSFQAAANP